MISFGGVPLFTQPEDTAIEAINLALDQGINYYDLDETKNQFIPGKVYKDGGRKIGQVLKHRRNDCYLGVKRRGYGPGQVAQGNLTRSNRYFSPCLFGYTGEDGDHPFKTGRAEGT